MGTEFAIAVKSFIVDDKGRILLIRRRPNDVQNPGDWDLPGGRLYRMEDPFKGLKRETKEETGLDIKVLNPMKVYHFRRYDNQMITMITFFCRPLSGSVQLSEEHTEHVWVSQEEYPSIVHPCFREEAELFRKHFL